MDARPSYIYGAGRMGREVLARQRSVGCEPRAFIDRDASRTVDGLPVIALGEVHDAVDSEVVIALHSPSVDVAEVAHGLAREAFARVDTLWSFCACNGWLPRSDYWLEPRFAWDGTSEAIASARALFDDACSLRVFDRQLALRRDGDYAGLDAPTPGDQYAPHDLPRWREPMHLLDAGAFDGDTMRALEAADYTVDRWIALEPDPANFRRLQARCGDRVGARLVEAGAAAAAGSCFFAAGEEAAAHVDRTGDTRIDLVAIDDLCDDFRPTLIKMDIEGAERDALDGTASTLRRDRPDLAISVYHRVDDLWTIPLAIADRVDDYRFALRSHAFNGFDTVLYGWAR